MPQTSITRTDDDVEGASVKGIMRALTPESEAGAGFGFSEVEVAA